MVTGSTPLASAILAYDMPRQNDLNISRSLSVSPPRPFLSPSSAPARIRAKTRVTTSAGHPQLACGHVPDRGQQDGLPPEGVGDGAPSPACPATLNSPDPSGMNRRPSLITNRGVDKCL